MNMNYEEVATSSSSQSSLDVFQTPELVYTSSELCIESTELSNVQVVVVDHCEKSDATEDESVVIEALRQLGHSAIISKNETRIETKTPKDLPLLPCLTCDSQFKTTSDLQSHQIICKESQHKCPKCDSVFDKKAEFNNHMICHAVERPHSCTICGVLFISKKELIRHMEKHGQVKNKNRCEVCGANFNRPSSLTNHMKIHTYQPGRALLEADVHIKTEYDKVEDVTNEVDLLSNIKDIKILNSWSLCPDDGFISNINVVQEMVIDNQEKTEPLNECKSSKPYRCDQCAKSFAREKALISHQNLHSNTLDRDVQCRKCDTWFGDEKSYKKHSLNCSNSDSKDKALPMMENVLQEQFEAAFISKDDTGDRFDCCECGKKFTTKQKLLRHMWIHRKKVYSCEICAATFEVKDELDIHRLSSHQTNTGYFCSECGKNFSSRQGLWEHSRIHGPTPNAFECQECTKTFTSRQGYLIHKRIHKNERPYGCRFCWKAFRDGGTLRKHERIHTGERPHACPICSRAFNQKVVLREHVRWLHAANKESNSEGTYDCPLCCSIISDKDELCAHIVKHSDQLALEAKKGNEKSSKKRNRQINQRKICDTNENIKTVNGYLEDLMPLKVEYECDMCANRFMSKSELTDHIKVHI